MYPSRKHRSQALSIAGLRHSEDQNLFGRVTAGCPVTKSIKSPFSRGGGYLDPSETKENSSDCFLLAIRRGKY